MFESGDAGKDPASFRTAVVKGIVTDGHVPADDFGCLLKEKTMMNGGFGGGFWMLLVWLVPIIAVIWAVTAISGKSRPDTRSKTASQILDEEYAKGEISREQYLQKKNDMA